MAHTPTSPAGIALAQLRRMVSLSTAFRTQFSAADATAALAYILIGRHPLSSLSTGGAIISNPLDGANQMLSSGGSQLFLEPKGIISLQLFCTLSSGDSIEDRYLKGTDFSSNTLSQVAELSDAADTGTAFGKNHLAITEMRENYAGPGDARFDASRGLWWYAEYRVDWGIVG